MTNKNRVQQGATLFLQREATRSLLSLSSGPFVLHKDRPSVVTSKSGKSKSYVNGFRDTFADRVLTIV